MTEAANPGRRKVIGFFLRGLTLLLATGGYRYWQSGKTASAPKATAPAIPVVTAMAKEPPAFAGTTHIFSAG